MPLVPPPALCARPAASGIAPISGVGNSVVRCTPRVHCVFHGPLRPRSGLGGLEQRLKIFGASVGRDLDDEALARVVRLDLLEHPGEDWGRG